MNESHITIHQTSPARSLGDPLIHFETIGSTNSAAVIAAQEGAAEGTIFLADEQTGGRGRQNRRWYSAPGKGLYFSLILRPEFPAYDVNKLVIQSAVAACEAIEAHSGGAVGLKWPNDLITDGKKLGGILLETGITGEQVNYAVIGIGINLTHRREDFEPELRESAVSIQSTTSVEITAAALLGTFLSTFEDYYYQMKPCSVEDWKERCVHMGGMVTADTGGMKVTGSFTEVYEDLSFLLRTSPGEEHIISYGEISLDLREGEYASDG